MARAATLSPVDYGGAFVGRHKELDRLRDAVAAGSRLVTLLGPGGIGKTRLVSRFATSGDATGAEVYFCDLAEAHSEREVVYQVASALDLILTADTDHTKVLDHIGHALAGRSGPLVILDNAEQVVTEVAAAVRRWHLAAPATRFLVTSREPLNLAAEVRVELGPLSPDDAVALFLDRFQAVRPGAPISEREHAVIRSLVDQLDRIPLAIEMAAARGAMMSLDDLLARLSHSLDVLRSRRRDLPERHLSLRATIAWSWELLTPWEQDALAQCGVFHGPFTLEAAEEVIDLSAHGQAPSTLDVIDSLREKSLLVISPGQAGMYVCSLYHSVRAFAGEKLDAMRGREAAEERHAAYYTRAAAAEAKKLTGTARGASLEAMETGLHNSLAAYRHAFAHSPERAVDLALSLNRFFTIRGPFEMHKRMLDEVISALAKSRDHALKSALYAARANMLSRAGRLDDARADAELALTHAESSGDPKTLGQAYCRLANILFYARELEKARTSFERAREHYAAAGDKDGEVHALAGYAKILHRTGDGRRALALYEDALGMARSGQDFDLVMTLHNQLGLLGAELGDIASARAHLRAGLTLGQEEGARMAVLFLRSALIYVEMNDGDLDTAAALLGEQIQDASRSGYPIWVAKVHSGLGLIAAERGDFAAFHRHFREAVAIYQAIGHKNQLCLCRGNQALGALLQGDLDQAHAYLAPNMEVLKVAPMVTWDGQGSIWLACMAVIHAQRGEVEAARTLLDDARASLVALKVDSLMPAVYVLEGFCDLALARREHAAGGVRAAFAHLDTVRSRLLPQTPSSVDLRLSQMMLQKALAATELALGGLLIGEDYVCPPGGEKIDLRRRPVLRLLLATLAAARQTAPGVPVPVDALCAAAWPDDKSDIEALHVRLRAAIAGLRKHGLGDLLLYDSGGYLLDPAVPMRMAD